MKSVIGSALLALALACVGCPEAEAPPPAGASPAPTIDPAWVGRENPLPADAATIERGRAAFLRTCATCHGPDGEGNGPASAGLKPPPANFRDGSRLASKDDDYLFWRISTGIHGTAMPAFSGTISEEERWAILRYLRSLPGAERRTRA
jgi:mono/diheme cytochrome c family protein